MADISIISPSLNSAESISDCIRSVEEQRHVAEHLVIDGYSSDGTSDVIRNLSENTRIVQEPPEGIYPAVNAGIQAAQGEIIGILHADDFYASPAVLDRVATVFEDPSVEACYGDLCYVEGSDPTRIVRYWRAGEYQPGRFHNGWMPPHPTFFVRKKIYEQYGLYRTDLGTSADYELMVRFLVKHGINTAYIPQVLVHMRTGGSSNASWRARFEANRMDRRAWQVNGLNPYPWTTLAKPLRKVGQWWSRP
ncbi:glycosyltransferase family 2 protein [Pseudomonadota bacterium]